MALRLITLVDADAVRWLLIPRIIQQQGLQAARAALPTSALFLPGIADRADAIVMQRLGGDWPAFADPTATIPTLYAQGDAVLARQLCHDALVHFVCARLAQSGLIQQLVAQTMRTADQELRFTLNWPQIGQQHDREGYAALDLLRRAVPVPHRRFLSPAAGASGQMCRTIRPGTHIHRHGLRSWPGGWPTEEW